MGTYTNPSMRLQKKRTMPPRNWPVEIKQEQRTQQQRQQHLKQMASRCRSWHKEKLCISQIQTPAASSAPHFKVSVLTATTRPISLKLRAPRKRKAPAKKM